MENETSRRDLIIGIAAIGVLELNSNRLFAQTPDSKPGPREVSSQLMLLERDAIGEGILVGHRGPTVQFSPSNVYLESLPRLVELVEKAADRKSPLAARAAILLSHVNAQEIVPAAFFEPRLKAAAPAFLSVKAQYQEMFKKMSIRPEHRGRVKWYADRLAANKFRYSTVATQTAVPWYAIGVMHALEASFNFLAHLHNGDVPLDKPTTHVPAGRPDPWIPPYTWARSAEDAMRIEHFADLTDWSLPHMLYRFEAYNGFGYRSEGVNSPYLWSFSDQYDAGKFVADRVWSKTTKSQQCGAAVMIYELARRGLVAV